MDEIVCRFVVDYDENEIERFDEIEQFDEIRVSDEIDTYMY